MEMDKLKSEDEVSKLQQQIVNKDLELKVIIRFSFLHLQDFKNDWQLTNRQKW